MDILHNVDTDGLSSACCASHALLCLSKFKTCKLNWPEQIWLYAIVAMHAHMLKRDMQLLDWSRYIMRGSSSWPARGLAADPTDVLHALGVYEHEGYAMTLLRKAIQQWDDQHAFQPEFILEEQAASVITGHMPSPHQVPFRAFALVQAGISRATSTLVSLLAKLLVNYHRLLLLDHRSMNSCATPTCLVGTNGP